MEYKDHLMLHIQRHGYWWSGDTRSQGIWSHGIGIAILNIPVSVTEGLRQRMGKVNLGIILQPVYEPIIEIS